MKRFFKITSPLSTKEVNEILDGILDKARAQNIYEIHQATFYELIMNEDGSLVESYKD